MSLEARRRTRIQVAKKADLNLLEDPRQPTPVRPKSVAPRSPRPIKYLEREPVLEPEIPESRRVFTTANSAAHTAITEGSDALTKVSYSDFLKHINLHVVQNVLGAPIRLALLKEILDGIEIEAIRLADTGVRVKIGPLGTVRKVRRSARQGRNPRTGETISVPASSTVRLTVGNVVSGILKG